MLVGIRVEASESPESAMAYYDDLLEKDESNAVSIVCRFIRVYLTETKGCLETANLNTSSDWQN